VGLASGSRNAAEISAAFDGVNRNHYFQGMTKKTRPVEETGRSFFTLADRPESAKCYSAFWPVKAHRA
jgi:hypothetical protein